MTDRFFFKNAWYEAIANQTDEVKLQVLEAIITDHIYPHYKAPTNRTAQALFELMWDDVQRTDGEYIRRVDTEERRKERREAKKNSL